MGVVGVDERSGRGGGGGRVLVVVVHGVRQALRDNIAILTKE